MNRKPNRMKLIVRLTLLALLIITSTYGTLCLIVLGDFDSLAALYRLFQKQRGMIPEHEAQRLRHLSEIERLKRFIVENQKEMMRLKAIEKSINPFNVSSCGYDPRDMKDTFICPITAQLLLHRITTAPPQDAIHSLKLFQADEYAKILQKSKNTADQKAALQIFTRDLRKGDASKLSYHTICDTLCLPYEVHGTQKRFHQRMEGTVYWASVSASAVHAGCQPTPIMNITNHLTIPLQKGENWITVFYTKDWNTFDFDKILMTYNPNIRMRDFLLTPQVSYRDSLLEFALSARISAQNIQDVSVVRINGSRQDCISSIKDDCGRSDGKMHDHVYTLRFKYKPSPLDQFMYRLKVVTAHDSAYSGLFHRSATAPIRRYRFIELKTTEDMMHMLYNRLKESGMPALGARDSVVSWLKQQQCVSSVQKVDSLFSFIKITFKQGVWCNVDLDMKPVYSFEEKVGTINWGVDAVLEPLEIQWNVEKYASNKQNRTKDGLSPVEYRFFNVSSTGTAYARSVEALLNILQAQSKFVYHAYFHHLTKQPDIEGTITVRFSITESGSVADCMLIDSAIHDSLFVEEVVSKVKKWSFESVTRPGDITIVEYPFFFHRPR